MWSSFHVRVLHGLSDLTAGDANGICFQYAQFFSLFFFFSVGRFSVSSYYTVFHSSIFLFLFTVYRSPFTVFIFLYSLFLSFPFSIINNCFLSLKFFLFVFEFSYQRSGSLGMFPIYITQIIMRAIEDSRDIKLNGARFAYHMNFPTFSILIKMHIIFGGEIACIDRSGWMFILGIKIARISRRNQRSISLLGWKSISSLPPISHSHLSLRKKHPIAPGLLDDSRIKLTN